MSPTPGNDVWRGPWRHDLHGRPLYTIVDEDATPDINDQVMAGGEVRSPDGYRQIAFTNPPADAASIAVEQATQDSRLGSLESTSATHSGRIDVLEEAGLNPDDFGAVGDGGSAALDTAGWAALLAALPTITGRKTGRIVVPPNRRYKINAGGMFNLDDVAGLEIEGVGGMSDLAGRPMIEWLGGAGSGPLIRAASASGLVLKGIVPVYSNAAYDGDLIKFGHSARAVDAFYPHIERCYIGGISGAVSARSLVNLDRAICGKILGNQWIDAVAGIRGVDGSYAIDFDISESNVFNRCSTASILNPGETWNIVGNAFEPAADGAPRGIISDPAVSIALGVVIGCNWWGDITDVGSPAAAWIDICGRGIYVYGNRMHLEVAGVAHKAVVFRNVLGGAIAANNFSSGGGGPVAIDFQLRSGQLSDGIEVRANRFTSITQVTNEANLTSGEYSNNVGLNDKKIGRPAALPSYTTATRPAAASYTGQLIYVSDAAAGSKLQYSDGAAWVAAG